MKKLFLLIICLFLTANLFASDKAVFFLNGKTLDINQVKQNGKHGGCDKTFLLSKDSAKREYILFSDNNKYAFYQHGNLYTDSGRFTAKLYRNDGKVIYEFPGHYEFPIETVNSKLWFFGENERYFAVAYHVYIEKNKDMLYVLDLESSEEKIAMGLKSHRHCGLVGKYFWYLENSPDMTNKIRQQHIWDYGANKTHVIQLAQNEKIRLHSEYNTYGIERKNSFRLYDIKTKEQLWQKDYSLYNGPRVRHNGKIYFLNVRRKGGGAYPTEIDHIELINWLNGTLIWKKKIGDCVSRPKLAYDVENEKFKIEVNVCRRSKNAPVPQLYILGNKTIDINLSGKITNETFSSKWNRDGHNYDYDGESNVLSIYQNSQLINKIPYPPHIK